MLKKKKKMQTSKDKSSAFGVLSDCHANLVVGNNAYELERLQHNPSPYSNAKKIFDHT